MLMTLCTCIICMYSIFEQSVLNRCGHRAVFSEILITVRLSGSGPGGFRNLFTLSTSYISDDASGLQRFPVRLSNLQEREQNPPQSEGAPELAVKFLTMINSCGRTYVICFIISLGVKNDLLIHSYCEFNL